LNGWGTAMRKATGNHYIIFCAAHCIVGWRAASYQPKGW